MLSVTATHLKMGYATRGGAETMYPQYRLKIRKIATAA
jgi:hypothetical protein